MEWNRYIGLAVALTLLSACMHKEEDDKSEPTTEKKFSKTHETVELHQEDVELPKFKDSLEDIRRCYKNINGHQFWNYSILVYQRVGNLPEAYIVCMKKSFPSEIYFTPHMIKFEGLQGLNESRVDKVSTGGWDYKFKLVESFGDLYSHILIDMDRNIYYLGNRYPPKACPSLPVPARYYTLKHSKYVKFAYLVVPKPLEEIKYNTSWKAGVGHGFRCHEPWEQQ